MSDKIVNKTIYGIAFDLVQAKLEKHYHVKSTGNAYNDIAEVLIARGFIVSRKVCILAMIVLVLLSVFWQCRKCLEGFLGSHRLLVI